MNVNCLTRILLMVALLGVMPSSMAQTVDSLISEGRTFLAAKNLTNAVAKFSAAVALSPNNETANAFLGVSRVLALPEAPVVSQFLNRMGLIGTNRSFRHWNTRLPVGTNGLPTIPSGMNANEITALAQTNALPEVLAAIGNLSKVASTGFALQLTTNETGASAVSVDYGDILLFKAMLQGSVYFLNTVDAWNVDAALSDLLAMNRVGGPTIERIFARYPGLLTFATTNQLSLARDAFVSAVATYETAMNIIRNRAPGSNAVFNYDALNAAGEERFHMTLVDLRTSLSLATTLRIRTAYTLRFANTFTGLTAPRAWLPSFASDGIALGTLADPTLGGVINGLQIEEAEGFLARHFKAYPLLDGTRRPAPGSVHLGLNTLAGHGYAIESTTNFAAWLRVTGAVSISNRIEFDLTAPLNDSTRFYRARELLNDAFADRFPLTGAMVSTHGSNKNATREPGEPIFSPTNFIGGRSVWWTWTPPATGLYTLRVPFSQFPPAVAVYNGGSIASLNRVNSGVAGQFSFSAAKGLPYVIMVDSTNGGGGEFDLVIAPPASNDSFTNRTSLTGTNLALRASNVGATAERIDTNVGMYAGHSVWWNWTAPVSGFVRFKAQGSEFPLLFVFGLGTNGLFQPINYIENSHQSHTAFVQATIGFDAVAGSSYAFALDSLSESVFDLSLRQYENRYPVILIPSPATAGTIETVPAPDADGLFRAGQTISIIPKPISPYIVARYRPVPTNTDPARYPLNGSLAVQVDFGLNGDNFGNLDTLFNPPALKKVVVAERVLSDGRGRLYWSFANNATKTMSGASGYRLGSVARTDENGRPDTNFVMGPTFSECLATAVQPDGKLLVSGNVQGDFSTEGIVNYRVYRFFTNGTFDLSFFSPVFQSVSRYLSLQPDGKLLVEEGSTAPVQNRGTVGLTRLNTNGGFDTTFQTPVLGHPLTGEGSIFSKPLLDSQGRILLGGYFGSVNGAFRPGVARLLADGSLDPAFVPSGFGSGNPRIRAVALQADGKILIAGAPMTVNGFTGQVVLLRLNTDGNLDTTFPLIEKGAAGFAAGFPREMAFGTDGRYLLLGATISRFNPTGNLDGTFHRPVLPANTEVFQGALLASGRAIIPTTSLTPTLTVDGQLVGGSFALNSAGVLDTTFTPPAFESETFNLSAAGTTNGGLIVWGDFDSTSDGFVRPAVVRFTSAGTVLPSYAPVFPTNVLFFNHATVASDESFYGLAQVGPRGGVPQGERLMRLFPGGQYDAAFANTVSTLSGPLDSVRAQGNKLLVWGQDAQSVLAGKPFFVRLNADGSRDTSFIGWTNRVGQFLRSGNSLSDVALGHFDILAAASDGSLIALLTENAYPPASTNYYYRIVKLTPSGTLDTTFFGPATLGPGNDETVDYPLLTDPQSGAISQVYVHGPKSGRIPITGAAFLPDSRVLIWGWFNFVGGYDSPGMLMLKRDGQVDTTFNTGYGPQVTDGYSALEVNEAVVDSSGRIYVTGNFTLWDKHPVPGVVRLAPDGKVDDSFAPDINKSLTGSSSTGGRGIVLGPGGSVTIIGPYTKRLEAWPSPILRFFP